MNVFDLRGQLVADYGDFIRGFLKIRDKRLNEFRSQVARCGGVLARAIHLAEPELRQRRLRRGSGRDRFAAPWLRDGIPSQ